MVSIIPSSIQMPPTAESELLSEGKVSSAVDGVDITKRGGGAVEFRTRPVSRIRKKTWLQCKRLKDENFISCDEDDEDGRFCCKILGLKRAKKPRRRTSGGRPPSKKLSFKSEPKVVSVGNHELIAFNLDDLDELGVTAGDDFSSDDKFVGKSYASPKEEFVGDMTSEWWSKEADYSYASLSSGKKSSSKDTQMFFPEEKEQSTRREKHELIKNKFKNLATAKKKDQSKHATMSAAARKRQHLRRLQEKQQQERLRQQNLEELLNPLLDKRNPRQHYKRLHQQKQYGLFQGGHRRGMSKYGNSQPRRRPNSHGRPKTGEEHYGKITLMDSGDFIGIDELNKMKGMITDEQEADLRTEEDFKEYISKEEEALIEKEEKLPVSYDRDNCADLKVPCRFVSDHPCCRFRMPVELVARVRAMDGSADLRWRSSSEEKNDLKQPKFKGPRAKAKARSMKMGWEKHEKSSGPLLPSNDDDNVDYTHTTSKTSVSVPRYSVAGGPDVLSTILGTCWRLHYVKCPPIRGNSWRKEAESPPHPCCLLVTNPAPKTPASNRLSRWLRGPSKGKEHFS